ncbi:MAG: Isomerizing Glutamine-fructose-6-phosphate aminotransferase [Candidatus Kaiserbacteria bacterium GW2011_GWA1_50_28]|uniref:Glutamine--fructose-6-phosphate aminotransferase [isomerizing] n=1 Tax=Candidatus Kaiserbacteria bacterium GW2011_GWA1_50_28 TaxID=1618668 RepID=A0A0G1WGW5_9BACT|nr:MAG: Isomerizing Glutamine-fructose-6-phosphate aminotransferase [Candidatus Kaiserbacteria bacterium GW2011_GWA1_50_28]
MCGIFAYTGQNGKDAAKVLLDGLVSLEYRGYDSAGIFTPESGVIKTPGAVAELRKRVPKKYSGKSGIAHLRWATHGEPTKVNAHPHGSGAIWLVHNGIIENFKELKKKLVTKGHAFVSDSDTEILAHLIEEHLKRERSFEKATLKALKEVRGTYGVAIQYKGEPEKLIAARMGSPIVLGIGKGEHFIASDPSPILKHTKKVLFLNDGEVAVLTPKSHTVYKLSKEIVHRMPEELDWSAEEAQKGGYEHFMLKEIMEAPEVVVNTLRGRLIPEKGMAKLGLNQRTAVIAISQSGETLDTLEAVREGKRKGALTLGIVNAVGSTIARETDAGVYNHAGPEIGVASTKAFVSQLIALALFTIFLGRQREMSVKTGREIAKELKALPKKLEKVLAGRKEFEKFAKKYKNARDFLFIGRKYNNPVAFEGALKLKEISYIHAEGYGAGEMKHGPIAMIDKDFPTFAIATKDSVYEKNVSNIHELKARKGPVIVLATEGDKEIAKLADDVVYVPKTLEMLSPILNVVPLQLFAYYFAKGKGLNPDRPRNLAKSVTVE